MIFLGTRKDTWNQKDIQGLKTLILCIFIFCILLGVYDNGINQRIQYMQYINNISQYDIVEGTIIDNPYSVRRYGNFPIHKRYLQTIEFKYHGVKQTASTNAYSQYSIGDIVEIAVNKSNYTILNRCIPYETTKYEKALYMWYLILLLVVFSVYILDRKYNKKQERKITSNTRKALKEKEKSYNNAIVEKQSFILKKITLQECSEQELQELMLHFSDIGIRFNTGTLWLLNNYYYSEDMQKILNLLSWIVTDNYFEYLENCHEQGLPENYYVLAKHDENYYCCCGESEWLYMYSKGVGITHTKYATIYDYIIEQIDKR